MKRLILVAAVLMYIGMITGTIYCADDTKAQSSAQGKVIPKRVQVDSNYDGKIDRTEQYDSEGRPVKTEVDNDGDGVMDETVIYKDGKPVKSEKDTNKDGRPDVWIDL